MIQIVLSLRISKENKINCVYLKKFAQPDCQINTCVKGCYYLIV